MWKVSMKGRKGRRKAQGCDKRRIEGQKDKEV